MSGRDASSRSRPCLTKIRPCGTRQNASFALEDRFATGYTVPDLDQTQVGLT